MVDHEANECVRGTIHSNGIENFWALLKRSLCGTYISVGVFHLCGYLDAEAFRHNSREISDGTRFIAVLRSVVGNA